MIEEQGRTMASHFEAAAILGVNPADVETLFKTRWIDIALLPRVSDLPPAEVSRRIAKVRSAGIFTTRKNPKQNEVFRAGELLHELRIRPFGAAPAAQS